MVVNSGFKAVFFRIPSKYGVGSGIVNKVVMLAAVIKDVNQADVLLLSCSILKVEVIAAACLLNEYVNAVVVSGVGCSVVAAHCAGKVILGILCNREQTKLVSLADLGRCCIAGFYGSCGFSFTANRANTVFIGVTLCRNKIALIAITASCGLAGIKGISLIRAGRCSGNTGVEVVVVALVGSTGRGLHICGNFFTKEQESEFGVVNKNVTGAGNGLNRVVASKLPGVNRVGFHPRKQNLNALHYATGAPSTARVAPTNVNVQKDAGNVTA